MKKQEQSCSVLLQQMQEASSLKGSTRAKAAAGGSSYWASCYHPLNVGINAEFLTKKKKNNNNILKSRSLETKYLQTSASSVCKRADESCCDRRREALQMWRKLWENACVCVCIHPWPSDPSRDQPKYVKTVQRVEFAQLARKDRYCDVISDYNLWKRFKTDRPKTVSDVCRRIKASPPDWSQHLVLIHSPSLLESGPDDNFSFFPPHNSALTVSASRRQRQLWPNSTVCSSHLRIKCR